uniref:Uncharacterized protein n=1 Tax=Arundo donax TaxID=35708 RepID=A0A0A8XRE3_ARUDO
MSSTELQYCPSFQTCWIMEDSPSFVSHISSYLNGFPSPRIALPLSSGSKDRRIGQWSNFTDMRCRTIARGKRAHQLAKASTLSKRTRIKCPPTTFFSRVQSKPKYHMSQSWHASTASRKPSIRYSSLSLGPNCSSLRRISLKSPMHTQGKSKSLLICFMISQVQMTYAKAPFLAHLLPYQCGSLSTF